MSACNTEEEAPRRRGGAGLVSTAMRDEMLSPFLYPRGAPKTEREGGMWTGMEGLGRCKEQKREEQLETLSVKGGMVSTLNLYPSRLYCACVCTHVRWRVVELGVSSYGPDGTAGGCKCHKAV